MSKYKITINGTPYVVEVERVDENATSDHNEQSSKVSSSVLAEQTVPDAEKTKDVVKSPMPGTIIAIKAAVGDKVHKGQAVVVLEAMKMNNEIASPREGTITAIHISKGAAVQGGDVLFEID